jgi:hypothetical protein
VSKSDDIRPEQCDHEGPLPCSRCCPCPTCTADRTEEAYP